MEDLDEKGVFPVVTTEDLAGIYYKGEGMCNVVFSFSPESLRFPGRILRVQKRAIDIRDQPLSLQQQKGLENEEKIAGRRFHDQFFRILIGREYFHSPVTAQLSSECVAKLQQILRESDHQRPKKQRLKTEIDPFCKLSQLSTDFCFIHSFHPDKDGGTGTDPSSLCIEIKPKCGLVANGLFLPHETRSIKSAFCRFCLYQALKCSRGEIPARSGYCPLLFFRSFCDPYDQQIARKMIGELLLNPQNNIKLFWNGMVEYAGELGRPQSATDLSRSNHSLDFALRNWFSDQTFSKAGIDRFLRTQSSCSEAVRKESPVLLPSEDQLCHLLSKILAEEQIFDRLSRLHHLDQFDIEAVFEFSRLILEKNVEMSSECIAQFCDNYARKVLTSQTLSVPELEDASLRDTLLDSLMVSEERSMHALEFLKRCPLQFDQQIDHSALPGSKDLFLTELRQATTIGLTVIANYLISMASKDCSLMIAIDTPRDLQSHVGNHQLQSPMFFSDHQMRRVEFLGKEYVYRVAVIDLDPKSSLKLKGYLDQDQLIVKTFKGLVLSSPSPPEPCTSGQ